MKNQLLKLRTGKGVTQKQVAEHIGCSYQCYQKYENGTREADYDTLSLLATYFNTSVDYLLGRTELHFPPLQWSEKEKALGIIPEYKEALSPDEIEVLDAYRAIKDEKGEKAAHAMKTLMEAYLDGKQQDE